MILTEDPPFTKEEEGVDFSKNENAEFPEEEEPLLKLLTPKIKLSYEDFKLVSETEYCQTFNAISRSDSQQYTIRTLNTASDFYKEYSDLATNYFIQELLRICTTCPGAILIESFETHDREQFSYAIKHCQSLQQLMDNDKPGAAKTIDFELLLKNVLSDINFLLTKFEISQTLSLDLQSIYQIDGPSGYFLSDWAKNLSIKPEENVHEANPDGANEVYNLGLKILELNDIRKEDIEDVVATRSAKLHNGGIDNMLAELKQPERLKTKLRKMLSKEVETRAKLNSLLQECESKPEEEKIDNKAISSRFSKVSRFEKIHPTETWSYCILYNDGISMTSSKNIKLEGIGLYVPTTPESSIIGTVKIVLGTPTEGTKLISKEVTLVSKAPEVVDKIYRVLFETPILVDAQTKYTIHLYLGPSEKYCAAYRGIGGRSIVMGDEGVVFTFATAFGEYRTSEFEGQIPEIYYTLN